MSTTGVWLRREPRDGFPAIVMRFHNDWWHTIFTASADSHEVVLGPMGIGLGTYRTLDQAKAAAEDNARTRALNTVETAQRDLRRASQVLAALGTAAPSEAES
jgi:hypothetical protein